LSRRVIITVRQHKPCDPKQKGDDRCDKKHMPDLPA
jgi:hypothetical protein